MRHPATVAASAGARHLHLCESRSPPATSAHSYAQQAGGQSAHQPGCRSRSSAFISANDTASGLTPNRWIQIPNSAGQVLDPGRELREVRG
jgi:hypothetical protein